MPAIVFTTESAVRATEREALIGVHLHLYMPSTIWILGDQLTHEHDALSTASPRDSRVLMVESRSRGSVHRYHKLKLVLVYSAMRHFAEELRARGWQVDYYRLEQGHTFATALDAHLQASRSDTLTLAEPNSFAETGAIEVIAAAAHMPRPARTSAR